MSKPDWTIERNELERVAQEYRDKGYHVIVEPTLSQTPDFVREFRPDIIATSGKESLIIEVKQVSHERDRDRVRAIAQLVERRPGWRFIVVTPQPREGVLPGEALRLMDASKVRELLREAQALADATHYKGALLLAWAAVEAAMRLAAQQQAIDPRRPDTWTLMRELVSNGTLDRESYQQLSDFFRLRSALAHGFDPLEVVDVSRKVGLAAKVTNELLPNSG
jgi:Holliday junction resolvase